MTILYVDDDPDDRQLFIEAVQTMDDQIACVTARDGVEALEYLQKNDLPDVVFLDINMPLMDGKRCLAEIRHNNRTSALPVIMFTTSNDPAEREECEVLGATEFVLKPVSYQDMASILNSIFRSSKFLYDLRGKD
jgi:CheY-like chemotaxis protein